MPSPNPSTTDWVPLYGLGIQDASQLVSIPVGMSIEWDYGSAQIPSWALLQYGQAVSRTTYSALAALASAVSYPHGSGDGSTTFNLADKRGRIAAGKDDMGGTAASRITAAICGTAGTVLGAAVGSEGVTLATAAIPSHSHNGATQLQNANHTHSGTTGTESSDHSHGDSGHYHNPAVMDIPWNNGRLGDGNQDFSGGGCESPFGTQGNRFYTNTGYVTTGTENVDHYHYQGVGGVSANHTHSIPAEGGGGAHLNMQPTIIVNRIVRAL